MKKELQPLMKGLGWVFVQTGPEEFEWRKFDKGGAPLAIQCDRIWLRDIAACETSLAIKTSIEKGVTAEDAVKPHIVESSDIVRVIRILEYVGPRKWVEDCIEKRGVKDIQRVADNAYISEAFLQRVPESVILEELKIDASIKASDKS